MNIFTTREKVENACHRLNAEAYEQQRLASSAHTLRHFTPCDKAEVLMRHLRKDEHFGTCHMLASITACPCHRELDERGLMDYEYDETFKLANYAHDLQSLYPRLYRGQR